MKRLLLDQGLPRSTGVILADAGWDVVHVAEVGTHQGSGWGASYDNVQPDPLCY